MQSQHVISTVEDYEPLIGRQAVRRPGESDTNDPTEARRSRYAQYRGQVATLTFGLATVRGMVQSVKEDGSSSPVRWLVTIVPKERRERL